MKMILLVGMSGTGKSFIVDAFDKKPVISHTERRLRKNESLTSYMFHFLGEYDEYIDKSKVIAHTKINGFNYWITEDDLINKDIFVIDPNGIRGLQDFYGIDAFYNAFKVVIVKMNHFKRLYNLLKRSYENSIDIKTLFKEVSVNLKKFFADFYTFRNIKKVRGIKFYR